LGTLGSLLLLYLYSTWQSFLTSDVVSGLCTVYGKANLASNVRTLVRRAAHHSTVHSTPLVCLTIRL